jgi:hypothetical protein
MIKDIEKVVKNLKCVIDMELYKRSIEHLDNAITALEQLQAENKQLREGQEWISVDDRLPEIIENCKGSIAGISEPVMVMFKDKGEVNSYMGVSRLFKGGRGDLTSFHWDFDYPKVTHWKPLPSPPQEKED